MRINTNVMALNAQNMLTKNQSGVEKSIRKLSSGLRINGAADDASGLAISEKMRAQIRGLNQAQSNAQDGISLLQTAEGALQQTTDILQRMRELVIKAQNTGVLTENDRTSINTELSTLRDEIDRIAYSTTFNGKKLLDGTLATQLKDGNKGIADAMNVDVSNAEAGVSYAVSVETVDTVDKLRMVWTDKSGTHTAYGDVVIKDSKITGRVNFGEAGIIIDYGDDGVAQTSAGGTIVTSETPAKGDFKIGANTYDQDVLSVGIGDMSSKGLNRNADGTEFALDISTSSAANDLLKSIDYALNKVSAQRSTLGVIQNRMEYAANNLATTEENLTAAESRIRDVDMAKEMVAYTKNSILNESAMAMLAQANKQPQAIITLLQ